MGSDSITRPWILERWSASDDLKVWSLGARKDVKWSNGKPLESGDIVANLTRWISKGSNLRHALRLQENNIEKFDQFTVRIYLDAPTIQIMETLAAGGAAVQNESFVSGGWEKFEFQPVTGQFQLQSYQPGIKAVLKRREGYRGPPAYLDGIEFFDFGKDAMATAAAAVSGLVDLVPTISPGLARLMVETKQLNVDSIYSAETAVARMKVNRKPFNDPKVDPRKTP